MIQKFYYSPSHLTPVPLRVATMLTSMCCFYMIIKPWVQLFLLLLSIIYSKDISPKMCNCSLAFLLLFNILIKINIYAEQIYAIYLYIKLWIAFEFFTVQASLKWCYFIYFCMSFQYIYIHIYNCIYICTYICFIGCNPKSIPLDQNM